MSRIILPHQVHNPQDPLPKSSAERGQELFLKFGGCADGYGHDDVMSASVNMMVNSIRQRHATKREAENYLRELFAKTAKILLEEHYDQHTGRRKSVFPFDQIIQMPQTKSKDGS